MEAFSFFAMAMRAPKSAALVVLVMVSIIMSSLAMAAFGQEQCGSKASGALCPDCLCCSKWGYCGSGSDYCGDGCQSQCHGCDGGGVASIISPSLFDQMLPMRNERPCPASGFYTYDAFIAAANAFPGFGTTGDLDTRKRELAAFMAQTSHLTTGGGESSRGGRYAWGYCFKEEAGYLRNDTLDYCQLSSQWPCAAGKHYYGRGPIQLTWNYNYGPAGEAIGVGLDLIRDPDLVVNDAVVSFKTAIWFWMTAQPPKPSCHAVMTGRWSPSAADLAAGRLPGYGVTTNIINGLQCGHDGAHYLDDNAVGFYRLFCDMLGVSYGDNLDCYNQGRFDADGVVSTSTTDDETAAAGGGLYHADA